MLRKVVGSAGAGPLLGLRWKTMGYCVRRDGEGCFQSKRFGDLPLTSVAICKRFAIGAIHSNIADVVCWTIQKYIHTSG